MSNNTKKGWPIVVQPGHQFSFLENSILSLADQQMAMRNISLEKQYTASLVNILNHGNLSGDRTGTGTLRIQSQYFHLDVANNRLPALQGKKIFVDKIIVEGIWMLLGKTNTEFLHEFGVKYWDKWADEKGDLGKTYGHQMRDFFGIDQLREIIDGIRMNPDGRRHLMTLWNPAQLKEMRLPPCHLLYQVCVFNNAPEGEEPDNVMDMHVTQRSGDSFIGIPYDFVLFTTFFRVISELVGIPMRSIHYTVNDYHMYLNHEDQVRQYIHNVTFDEKGIIGSTPIPEMWMVRSLVRDDIDIDKFLEHVVENKMADFKVNDFKSYPHIKAPLAV